MKNKIFERLMSYGWNLNNNTIEDFNNVYNLHCDNIDSWYDYIVSQDYDFSMQDISKQSFTDMIDFMSDFLRAIADIENEHINSLEDDDYYYIVFILSRDLIKDVLPYCTDDAYNFCKIVAKDFKTSKYNVSTKGLYECLEEYVKDNFYLYEGEITWKGNKIQ